MSKHLSQSVSAAAVVDASGLLALIRSEAGADIIEGLLGRIIMSSVNVSEVAHILMDLGMSKEICRETIEPFVYKVVEFDTDLAFLAASLKKSTKHKGLSFGDRACLALGIKLKSPVYTADRVWGELRIDNLDVRLIR
ncbi:MAG: type II toxin-antitoxin system VapC family toxin [Rickettsiaceae bacterium]|nr:type II toxin-antitoxin system VapC family toxin [Rickettsiaceae bacterium]